MNGSECLACVVLDDSGSWLGNPTPTHLDAFLWGAYFRAGLTKPALHSWRIFGPLRVPEFSSQLVERTGDPQLTVGWALALEMLYFRMDHAMLELKQLAHSWLEAGRVNVLEEVGPIHPGEPDSWRAFWDSFMQRPGMYLGTLSGWSLYCFLQGLTRGGDWLGLPHVPQLITVVQELAEQSRAAYGSDFAAYRVYGMDAVHLLRWVEPQESSRGDVH